MERRTKEETDELAARRRRQRGITLVELLIVMVIIGLLATLGFTKLFPKVGEAKIKIASAQMAMLGTALDMYRLDVGLYPSTDQGLNALVAQPDGVPGWKGSYLRKKDVPKDPWGHDYHYRSPGEDDRDYDLESYGLDDKPGGSGESADVRSWE